MLQPFHDPSRVSHVAQGLIKVPLRAIRLAPGLMKVTLRATGLAHSLTQMTFFAIDGTISSSIRES